MATLTGKITDVTGRSPDSISSITVKAPSARIGSGTDIIVSSPAEVTFDKTTGDITISGLTGGLSWLYIEGDGWSDSIPLAVAEGMITLVEAVANAAGAPGIADYTRLLANLELAVDNIALDAVDQASKDIQWHKGGITDAHQTMADVEIGHWNIGGRPAAERLGLPSDFGSLQVMQIGASRSAFFLGQTTGFWTATEKDGVWGEWKKTPDFDDLTVARDELSETLSTKADTSYVDAQDTALGQRIDAKADTSYVDAQDTALGQRIEEINVTSAEDVAGTEWAHVTEHGDRLPLGYAPDGTLDPHARQVWSEQVNGTHWTALDNRYAYVMATDEGHLLMAFRPDGTVVAPGLKTPQGVSPGDQIIGPDGTITPAISDVRHIYAWGSSSMNRLANNLDPMVTQWGTTYHNQAQPGETIQHIAARMGATPAVIEPVTIPESGGVAVTSSNYPVSGQIRTFSGTLAGVPGTLGWSGAAVTFTRRETGPEFQVTEPTPFIPTPDPQARRSMTIISAGKNNVSDPDGVQTVLDATDAMVDYLTPRIKRVVVMGHFQNRNWTPESPEWGRVEEINRVLGQRYGAWFFDHAAALASSEIWGLAGVAPTADDLTAQEIGRLPPSLSSDHQHQNENADIAVGKLLLRHMAHLGWA